MQEEPVKPTTRPFEAEVAEVLRLVVTSLYSHSDVFLRELVSNASDALDKLRFRSIQEPDLLAADETLRIRVEADAEARTLTVWDNGIGMSAEELAENLGTIARSGTREFAQRLQAARQSEGRGVELIGQFGVGFYSAFLVADRVEVVSRAAGSGGAHRWSSDGKETYTVEPAERDVPGTTVILYLKNDELEFLEPGRLRSLIVRYSDYIGHPIELAKSADAKKEPEFERVNRASALWQRPPKEVTPEQYEELYKHLVHDWEAPLARRHFRAEGTQEFVGLLFVPRRPPLDLFDPKGSRGLRLHVKRVFVMDDCEELLPRWLRFIRGVVDSEDLPLNVSRETLQDSRIVRTIRKQVIGQALGMLEELAAERAADYETFWKAFGVVLKEGVVVDSDHRDRLRQLLRYESSGDRGLVSLDGYVEQMSEAQPAIYYVSGTSRAVLAASPHLEALRARDYEVLFMTDPVDPFVADALSEHKGKPLVSATGDDLRLPDKGEGSADEPDDDPVLERFRTVLGDRVAAVRRSTRLTDSAVCLVVGEGMLDPHVERLLRAQNADVPVSKRTVEVNLAHPVVQNLKALAQREPESPRLADWIEVLYGQALIAEGSPIEDAAAFSRRLTTLLKEATRIVP